MNVVLSPATAKLLEEHMKRGGFASADDAVRLALETLGQVEGEAIEDLDSETLAAIERAEAQGDRGEGMQVDVAFERLRRKHFGE